MPVTVKTSGGSVKQDNVTAIFLETADMAKSPPELTFG